MIPSKTLAFKTPELTDTSAAQSNTNRFQISPLSTNTARISDTLTRVIKTGSYDTKHISLLPPKVLNKSNRTSPVSPLMTISASSDDL